MLDSGSSVSLLSQETALQLTGAEQQPLPQVQLHTESGESLPIIDYVSVDVQLDTMSTSVHHQIYYSYNAWGQACFKEGEYVV